METATDNKPSAGDFGKLMKDRKIPQRKILIAWFNFSIDEKISKFANIAK
ncbi:MAG: hypothetical protein GWN16_12640 [Calditrichae bacterium]|nr:hypothetical protein [Calditrichia bacterium]